MVNLDKKGSDTIKTRTIIGIVLIALSIAGLLYWELSGREYFTSTQVLAASKDLEKGKVIEASDIGTVRLSQGSVPKGSLKPSEASKIIGKTASVAISAGQSLEEGFFAERNRVFEKGRSIYSLPDEWILSRPAMLRAGDRVGVYLPSEKKKLGSYEVAFVRDSTELAVKGDEDDNDGVLSRENGSAVISSVEIICTVYDYYDLYDRSEESEQPFILLVPEAVK